MKDAPGDQGSVLEILSAFVRLQAGKPRANEERPPVEVAATMRVIGRRDATRDPADAPRLNLSEANLSYVSLRDGNYANANFWKANLEHAYLVRTKFTNALLGGTRLDDAITDGADFAGAKYDSTTRWPAGVDPAELGAGWETPTV
jgi:hypothetical protein